jgi:hypothetical protein
MGGPESEQLQLLVWYAPTAYLTNKSGVWGAWGVDVTKNRADKELKSLLVCVRTFAAQIESAAPSRSQPAGQPPPEPLKMPLALATAPT